MTVLCETCFPYSGDQAVYTIVPMSPCQQCGKWCNRDKGEIAHLYVKDPRQEVTHE